MRYWPNVFLSGSTRDREWCSRVVRAFDRGQPRQSRFSHEHAPDLYTHTYTAWPPLRLSLSILSDTLSYISDKYWFCVVWPEATGEDSVLFGRVSVRFVGVVARLMCQVILIYSAVEAPITLLPAKIRRKHNRICPPQRNKKHLTPSNYHLPAGASIRRFGRFRSASEISRIVSPYMVCAKHKFIRRISPKIIRIPILNHPAGRAQQPGRLPILLLQFGLASPELFNWIAIHAQARACRSACDACLFECRSEWWRPALMRRNGRNGHSLNCYFMSAPHIFEALQTSRSPMPARVGQFFLYSGCCVGCRSARQCGVHHPRGQRAAASKQANPPLGIHISHARLVRCDRAGGQLVRFNDDVEQLLLRPVSNYIENKFRFHFASIYYWNVCARFRCDGGFGWLVLLQIRRQNGCAFQLFMRTNCARKTQQRYKCVTQRASRVDGNRRNYRVGSGGGYAGVVACGGEEGGYA